MVSRQFALLVDRRGYDFSSETLAEVTISRSVVLEGRKFSATSSEKIVTPGLINNDLSPIN